MSISSEKPLASGIGAGFGPGTRLLIPAYAGTMLLSAGLLFLIQPIFARMALPLLGGSPSVWAIAMCFFQAVLLCGYAYAHLVSRHLSLKAGIAVHVTLLLLATQALPIMAPEVTDMRTDAAAGVWLVWIFAKSVGFPFFVLSATAPLLQAWFARTHHPAAANPYFLYGASNLGSIGSLLLYPVLIEHMLGLGAQSGAWTTGFVALALAMVFCGLLALAHASPAQLTQQVEADAPSITAMDRVEWIILAFVPSALLVAWTNHLTTDIASAPFLWLPPLVLFLLTFVVVFKDKPLLSPRLLGTVQLVALPLALFIPKAAGLGFTAAAFVFGALSFFATACLCHHRLYLRRPPAARLTEFYMLMSVGGVLGGLFVSLLAPVLFNTVVEYKMLLLLGLFLRHDLLQNPRFREFVPGLSFVPVAAVLAVVIFMLRDAYSHPLLWHYGVAIAAVVLCLVFGLMKKPQLIAYPAVLAVICAITAPAPSLHDSRSYFGVLRVLQEEGGAYRVLAHGTTRHGAQAADPARELTPLSYYTAGSGMAEAIHAVQAALAGTGQPAQVGVVGLGTGSLACYAKPDERWAFYEIDPEVIRVALNPDYFTFLSKCGPTMRMVEGDARLMLTKEPARSNDLLMIDAFSSDSVPVHLLTAEAMQLYLNVISERGTLTFHISNRFMDLAPVVAATMKQVDPTLKPIFIRHRVAGDQPLVISSDVMVFSRNAEAARTLLALPHAVAYQPPEDVAPWSDDYANVPGAIWRQITAQ